MAPSDEARSPAAASPAAEPAPQPAEGASPAETRRPLRDLCKQPEGDAPLLDDTQRVLEETFCAATLWFDSLLGGEPHVESARQVGGWIELSTLYSEFERFESDARLHLRYDLPNLERRFSAFLGRDDEEQFIEDRREGFAIRSSIFGLNTPTGWFAGLGYSPGGPGDDGVDFRLGARLKSAPELFTQARYRANYFVGDSSAWHIRETVFWENRDGFGATTSLEFDRLLHRDLAFRWGSIGTFSESTEGVEWRSAFILYHNLRRSRALAGELFARGRTDHEVPLREYGARALYRRPVGKPYLFGSLLVGYSWPREEIEEPRDGSAMIGVGAELFFGREWRRAARGGG